MARSDDQKAAVTALNRFGLGGRPGDVSAIGSDGRGALLKEIALGAAALPDSDTLPSSIEAYRRLRVEQDEVRARREASKQAPVSPPEKRSAADAALQPSMDGGGIKPAAETGQARFRRQAVRTVFQAETSARLQAASAAPIGFCERLVLFWSNHFCVSARKGPVVRILAGAYEREAIRPHVFGRFADMLLAVEKHPAMLVYLDNEQSVGPNSRGGQRQQRGLNENLAREIMELHTLGVDGGYSQEDVTSLSRILTGWRFARRDSEFAGEGRFVFNPNLHEPGDHRLMGVVYREDGGTQGEAALLALAEHPATAQHIAVKLATHFVSDTPDPRLVARLEQTFRDTQGNLAAVSRALIEAPEAWQAEPSKLRTPYEFLAASARATGAALDAPMINRALTSMGHPLWSPSGPNGFSDQTSAWASPEGMKARLDFSAGLAQLVPGSASPAELLEDILGPAASDHTRTAIARAESREQGFTLLLMSPEFQRR